MVLRLSLREPQRNGVNFVKNLSVVYLYRRYLLYLALTSATSLGLLYIWPILLSQAANRQKMCRIKL